MTDHRAASREAMTRLLAVLASWLVAGVIVIACAQPAAGEVGMVDGAKTLADGLTVTLAATSPPGYSDPAHGNETWTALRAGLPATRIIAVRAVTNSDDPGRDAQIGEAIDKLGRRGVPVVSVAMGRYMPSSPATCSALRRWPATTFVVGAGNGGTNNDVVPFFPASCRYVPNVIRAGSLGADGLRAPFSNYGWRGTYSYWPSSSTSEATRAVTVLTLKRLRASP